MTDTTEDTQSGIQGILSREAKIGEILIQQTSLTENQLAQALELQRQSGGRLGEILVQKKFLQAHEILIALSLQLGIPFVKEIEVENIDPEWIEDLPIAYSRQQEVLPIATDENTVTVAIADPFNLQVLDDLRVIYQKEIKPVLSEDKVILSCINRVYEKSRQNAMSEIQDDTDEFQYDLDEPADLLESSEDDAPVIRFVNNLLFRAIKDKASDIHIEPYEKSLVVRFRIDGVLHDIATPPKGLHAGISSRIKLMGELDIAEKRLPQDGRIKIKIAGKDIDIRLSVLPTRHGERHVLRILDTSSVQLDLATLGFHAKSVKVVDKLIHSKHGIVLVTGPTGSGKTTTLNACLTRINSTERNIITIEDPIEYDVKGVGQIQVNPKVGLTFASGLRAILRQDPDVVMVGEIRDKETAEIAIQASLTGHLVLASVHTNDAPGAITRLTDMGIEPFLVASSLMAVLAQRLVRKVCSNCKIMYHPTDVEFENLNLDPEKFKGVEVAKEKGCHLCGQTGYTGRTIVHELMLIDDTIRHQIMERADSSSIKKHALEGGMVALRDDGIRKVVEGLTTPAELVSVTQE